MIIRNMANNKIALFFDIDGTLFDGNTRTIMPSTIKLLELLSKNDRYDLYLSTGRSYETLGTIKKYLHYFKGLNLSNGQEIYLNGELIKESFIEKDYIKDILEKSVIRNTPIGLITKDEIEINFITDEGSQYFSTFIKLDVKNLNYGEFDLNKGVYQLWLFANNEMIEKYQKEFQNLEIIKWGSYGADVIPLNASKAKGIKYIQDLMKYELNNMYAFGDGDNDAKMFKAVGTSVAMGNASDLAKKNSTFITDNIEQDGLYNACLKLKLIEE